MYEVRAYNTASASENAIHHDDVAQAYGFSGGLVPGVDVYAYLTHPVVEAWGLDWLRRGTIAARFAHPVYDGDVVRVAGHPEELQLVDSAGVVCATATAGLQDTSPAPPDPTRYAVADLPVDRPPASPSSLAIGRVLGTVRAGFHAEHAGAYLDDVRDTLAVYRDEGVAHPGWLLRFANTILAANVRLGPWIHVGSDVQCFAPVRDGDDVEARAVVTDQRERKGHRFVTLDVLLIASGHPAQQITHTAIYEPRRVR
jgi:acyl dehydratase